MFVRGPGPQGDPEGVFYCGRVLRRSNSVGGWGLMLVRGPGPQGDPGGLLSREPPTKLKLGGWGLLQLRFFKCLLGVPGVFFRGRVLRCSSSVGGWVLYNEDTKCITWGAAPKRLNTRHSSLFMNHGGQVITKAR
jgi:hypothetical protein